MYRIRRLTGGEITLASLDELAAAIVAGTVTAEAEIHHQRADRWLPIANHPHFKIASDRASSAASPAPKTAPIPAQPALRLVRSDMSASAAAPLESRPASRWTPPRPSVATPRSTGSAAPAMEPPSQLVEFVAEAPAAEAPAAEPVRPKRIEPATAGLPMLDIEMPQSPRPMRAPTPMPAPISWPTMHAKPRAEPVAQKTAEPVAPKAAEPVAAAAAPTPVAVIAPEPVVEVIAASAPEPVAPVAVAPEPVSSMPWQVAEDSLDVPPPVSHFDTASAPIEPVMELEPAMATAEPSAHPAKSRWPMYVGAAVVLGAMAFFALRPRADVESLAPKPTAPVASKGAPASSGISVDAHAASMRPQITPIVPSGPSAEVTDPTPEPAAAPVVPAAPRIKDMVPSSAVGNLDLQLDPTAAQRQKALEETRRQIETQMQR
jgi:hypothetical protein